MRVRTLLIIFGVLMLVAGGGVGLWLTGWWEHWLGASATVEEEHDHAHESARVKLSPAAIENLKITTRRLKLDEHQRSIQIPGVVIDRPGLTDRGVTASVTGVVSKVHAFPGDIVRSGQVLFTIRLVSEYIQHAQMELFKNAKEYQINEEQLPKIRQLAAAGSEPAIKVKEMENQSRRLAATLLSYRQDLLTKGLTREQVQQVEEGSFVKEIAIVAPRPHEEAPRTLESPSLPTESKDPAVFYEVQELKVNLGEQVQAGQVLGTLSDHQWLYIEGRSFKKDASDLEQAAKHGWPVDVEFPDDDPERWPKLNQEFRIRHLANSVDIASRTFGFYLPLTNQSRTHDIDGRRVLVWRFRPGQRVRLHVPVEKYKDVFVLPAAAVVRDAGEMYVFRQNGKVFDRVPVRVLHEDRRFVVLANDGSIAPGIVVADNGAAALQRVLKAQQSGGGGHDHDHHHH